MKSNIGKGSVMIEEVCCVETKALGVEGQYANEKCSDELLTNQTHATDIYKQMDGLNDKTIGQTGVFFCRN